MQERKVSEQNGIRSFFILDESPHAKFNFLKFISSDYYNAFVVGSLSSSNIEKLDVYLQQALQKIQETFDERDEEILDRMKNSIYSAGDYLAELFAADKQQVDDVDLSVGFLAFKDDVMYAWLDGDMNVRMYRNGQSLLINDEERVQYYGSTRVLLGDVVCVSRAKLIREADQDYEEYVLENAQAYYPSLYLDYQVEQEQGPDFTYKDLHPAQVNQIPSHEQSIQNSIEGSSFVVENQASQPSMNVKIPQVIQKIFTGFKKMIGTIWRLFMKFTSLILDFGYSVLLRKSSHQLKRFQSSAKKKYLQYLLILVFFFLFFLLVVSTWLF